MLPFCLALHSFVSFQDCKLSINYSCKKECGILKFFCLGNIFDLELQVKVWLESKLTMLFVVLQFVLCQIQDSHSH